MIEKEIKSIKFGLLSPEMIRKMSAVRIITPDTYSDDGYPIEGGLMDLRMGIIDPGLRCKTCGGRMNSCPGHFGSVELVRPVIHIGYVKMILTLLKATCSSCGRILVGPDKIEELKELMLREEEGKTIIEEEEKEALELIKERMGEEEKDITEEKALDLIERAKKASKCPHCKAKQGKIKLVKPTTFYEDDKRLLPSEIRERLERIPDADLKLLGINPEAARPEWAVLTVLPVPPVSARPSIILETGERSEDDLTHKLVDIIRINQRLADNISAGAPQLIIEDLWDLLQYHVTTYFNNEVSGIPPAKHRSGRALKTLFQRLKGKEGRIRNYLSGKRVNFSARTVISPDPSLSISEVGVPQEIAEELTVPVHVTEWNLDEMKKFIKSKTYPKANYVIRPDGRRKKITELNREEIVDELTPGYIVERQLVDGDISFFNRQPSLHRVSMMAHKVRVLPGKTFRMNDATSEPYNADYDGDEMNLHIPQTEEAKTEAEELMPVEKHIISIRHGEPLVKGHHDHVSGIYFLTNSKAWFTREEASWLLGQIGIKELPEPRSNGKYHGKDIFSMLLPEDFSITYLSKMCVHCGTCEKEKCEFEAYVKIEKGKLISGAIESKGVGGELLKKMFLEKGPKITREYLDRVTKISLATLMLKGLTIGLSDYDISEETQKKIKKILSNGEKEVNALIEKYRKGELESTPGKTVEETLEDIIMDVLARTRTDVGRVIERSLGQENPAVLMSKSGARGSLINVTQMAGCIGQTSVRGKRISRGYRNKSLPHFKEGDISAGARGFIKSSFKDGLKPTEFFFHAMSGRDGLVDKGINTSVSGYMQRRLINALMDLIVEQDSTVRDASSNIIQFAYGEDGLNPMKTGEENLKEKISD